MATMSYRINDGPAATVEFTKELRIGSDAERNKLVLPATLGIAGEHAIVTRTVVGKLPVLVNLAGSGLRVNRQNVVSLKVLHHGDKIQVGATELELREMQIRRLTAALPNECRFCYLDMKTSDEIVSCPNCQTPHHKVCWFKQKHCSNEACLYPVRERIIKALASRCTFVTSLESSSSLVLKQKRCPANQDIDGQPFQPDQDVAFCPNCEATLHVECWVGLDKCPACPYNIKDLFDEVFDARPQQEAER